MGSLTPREELEIEIPVSREPGVIKESERSALEPRSRSAVIQRAMNVVIASAAIILVSPIMIVFAALKSTFPGKGK